MAITFKEIKRGFPIYILRRTNDSVEATDGRVIKVSDPHLPNVNGGLPSLTQPYTQMQQLMVDVTIEENGVNTQYCIPENLSVTYAGDMTLATERDGIIREVKALEAQDEEAIKSLPMHQKRKAACSAILEQWDTAYKDRKENKERIAAIEQQYAKVDGRLNQLDTKLDKLLKKLE